VIVTSIKFFFCVFVILLSECNVVLFTVLV